MQGIEPRLERPYPVGYGLPIIEPQTAPAAGANFSLTLPGGFIGRLLSAVFTFTSDATAANRSLRLEYDDGNGAVFAGAGAGAVIPASQTTRWRFTPNRGAADWDSNNFFYVPLPSLILMPGQKVQVNVTNIQATDALTAIVFTWQRFNKEHDDWSLLGG
jgi:FtsP/CotA-like multicopper oxidase with cupredoxin domain